AMRQQEAAETSFWRYRLELGGQNPGYGGERQCLVNMRSDHSGRLTPAKQSPKFFETRELTFTPLPGTWASLKMMHDACWKAPAQLTGQLLRGSARSSAALLASG